MKISIVTPSFNSESFIEDNIRSVIEQDHNDFEHIVIDGASTDDTVKTLQKFPHLEWISESDKGQSDALNKGFQKATGDIIGWLNADDFYLPGTFEKIEKAFRENPDADVIYGNWSYVDERGNLIKRCQSAPYNRRAIIYYGPYIGSTALFFRRDVIEEATLLDLKFHFTMDWEWYARLGKLKKKFIYINEDLAGFRVHGDNASLKFRKLSDMDKIFLRAKQLAEGQSIKRFYGMRIARGENGSLLEDAVFRFLWWFYRIRIMGSKFFLLLKSRPASVAGYIGKRKAEVNV